MNCHICGTEFEAKKSSAKTCSARCRQRLRRGKTNPAPEQPPAPVVGAVLLSEATKRQLLDEMKARVGVESDNELILKLAHASMHTNPSGVPNLAIGLAAVARATGREAVTVNFGRVKVNLTK